LTLIGATDSGDARLSTPSTATRAASPAASAAPAMSAMPSSISLEPVAAITSIAAVSAVTAVTPVPSWDVALAGDVRSRETGAISPVSASRAEVGISALALGRREVAILHIVVVDAWFFRRRGDRCAGIAFAIRVVFVVVHNGA
jgi:hypothetical protein